MKFSSFSKFALLSLLAGALALALTGCGSTNNLALTQGNWSVAATSTSAGFVARNNVTRNVEANNVFSIGGNLTQTGSSLAGTMYVTGSCIDSSQAISFTGTVKGDKVTLTSSSASEVIAVTGSGTPGAAGTTVSSLTGNYTATGGCFGSSSDSGTVTANAVPSISGTWSGPIQDSYENPDAVVSIALTQASTASSDGTFALTGTLTYINSGCFSSGTIQAGSATIAGSSLVINNAITDDGGDVSYTNVQLNNPASPTSITGTYGVSDSGENCDGENNTVTLTKQ
jgi:hypothetical protein